MHSYRNKCYHNVANWYNGEIALLNINYGDTSLFLNYSHSNLAYLSPHKCEVYTEKHVGHYVKVS